MTAAGTAVERIRREREERAAAEQAWQLRAVAIAMRLGGCDVVVAADDADGPVRVRYAATGLPYRDGLTGEERAEVLRTLGRALVMRKAG